MIHHSFSSWIFFDYLVTVLYSRTQITSYKPGQFTNRRQRKPHSDCTPVRRCGNFTLPALRFEDRGYHNLGLSLVGLLAKLLRRALDSDLFFRILEVADHRSENRLTELGMIAQAMEFAKINGVVGDYFEFGLWQGKTFRYAHKMMRRYSVKGMKLWGFDSFQGLPTHQSRPDNIWYEGQFAYGRDQLERDILACGFKPQDYELVEGFYDQSLDDALVERLIRDQVKASIVYIDCDLYESTRPVMRFISNFLQNGTILCFDDYFTYKGASDEGEARALAEFSAQNPRFCFIPYMSYSPVGQSFIVRIRP